MFYRQSASMSGMPRRIVMDVDTGIDDALAILYAVRHPDLELLGISCVAGNVPLDQVVINTCKVLDAAGAADIPVAASAVQTPMKRTRWQGGSHGPDGLGGIHLRETSRNRSPLPAVELLHQLIMASTRRVTLISLGPKTNVATLLKTYPQVAARLDQIIFMGGSVSQAGETPAAEFNVSQDPEAAKCVIESPIPITLYGLDMFDRLAVSQADADGFRNHDHPATRLVGDLLYRRRPRSKASTQEYVGLLGDAGALVLLTRPELFDTRELPVVVHLDGDTRGQIAIDPDLGTRVAVTVDLEATQAASEFVNVIDSYAA
jgi:pyrimidine-specific ribonucleoside hydrolase